MRTLIVWSIAAATFAAPRAFAQPAAPDRAGSAAAAAPADGEPAGGPAADAPSMPAPPPENTTALRHACEAAVASAAQAKNNLFVIDVSNVAAGAMSREELAKSPEGRGCLTAIDVNAEMRSSMAIAANEAAATERVALGRKEHEDAARAIAKNEKHVVLAYAALWLLAAGFVVFLWRRQQVLRSEIARLRRDLDAATK